LRLIRRNGDAEALPSKVPHMRVLAGERFACVGPAGGGYGDPLRRDPARVREDVADGFVSVEAAKNDYGVVLTGPGVVDEAATAHLRDAILAARGSGTS
jgi:N-methylhydantoinase B